MAISTYLYATIALKSDMMTLAVVLQLANSRNKVHLLLAPVQQLANAVSGAIKHCALSCYLVLIMSCEIFATYRLKVGLYGRHIIVLYI